MKPQMIGYAVLALLAGLLGSVTAEADSLVFAAASTTNAVTDIGNAFAAKGLGKIKASYASSSALAKQIESGAPASVFISADEQWMDYVDQKKLLVANTRVDLLGNKLVLIAPKDSKIKTEITKGMDIGKLLGGGRMSVGDPAHVPAGLYAQEALKNLGLWDQVKDHLASAEDVRAALAFVERGETPLGIVYATDAAISDKVKVIATFPDGSSAPVLYPVALVAGHDDAESRAFFDFLKGPEAKAIFLKYGFAAK